MPLFKELMDTQKGVNKDLYLREDIHFVSTKKEVGDSQALRVSLMEQFKVLMNTLI